MEAKYVIYFNRWKLLNLKKCLLIVSPFFIKQYVLHSQAKTYGNALSDILVKTELCTLFPIIITNYSLGRIEILKNYAFIFNRKPTQPFPCFAPGHNTFAYVTSFVSQ